MRPIRTLGCVLAFASLVAIGARADETDRLTYLTFSGPVQLPGITLAAGTYTFKLADLSGSRHVVHVFSKEESPKLITTLMTIPNERLEPVKDTFIMFQERPAGTPQAMKAWFYPGQSIGEEFIYPKQQAIGIARANSTSVLSNEGDTIGRVSSKGRFEKDSTSTSTTSTTADSTSTGRRPVKTEVVPADTTTTASRSRTTTADASNSATTARSATTASSTARTQSSTTVDADRTTTESTETESAAPATTAPAPIAETAPVVEAPAPVAEAEVVSPAPVVRAEPAPIGTSGQVARTLPRTASPLALFELISALSIAGGAGLRQLRKRA
jgi:hypothetical protein